MGQCGTTISPEDAFQRSITMQIEERMKEEHIEQQKTLNILLLGAGGSGKTTVYKQMEKVFTGSIKQEEMKISVHTIRENIIDDIVNLCKFNVDQNGDEKEINSLCLKFANMNDSISVELTTNLANEIYTLWNKDKSIQNVWNIRKKTHTMDTTPYFFNKAVQIANTDYIVTFDDFVRVRDPTTGIMDKTYLVQHEYGEYKFNITDVGGQRSERRKWIKLFDKMNVVVYVVNLAGYDQSLYEDHNRNRLTESIQLFENINMEKAFDDTDWVIFFNKFDVFEEKIKSVPFTKYKSDFNDKYKNDAEKVEEYIRNEFDDKFHSNCNEHLTETISHNKRLKRSIYFHTICAIDEEDISQCINKVQIDIIRSCMKKMGFMN